MNLKHRSFFQLHYQLRILWIILIKEYLIHVFVISGLIPGMLVLSGGPIICSFVHNAIASWRTRAQPLKHGTSTWFLCHWLPLKIWINLGMTWYDLWNIFHFLPFSWSSNIFRFFQAKMALKIVNKNVKNSEPSYSMSHKPFPNVVRA